MITRHMRIHLKRSSKKKYPPFQGKEEPDTTTAASTTPTPKGSLSSGDATDSPDQSARACSVSSADSIDSEHTNGSSSSSQQQKQQAFIGGGSSSEGIEADRSSCSSGRPRFWSTASGESTDLEEHPSNSSNTSTSNNNQQVMPVFVDSGEGGVPPHLNYRKSRNWSTTSHESVDSEETASGIQDTFLDELTFDMNQPMAAAVSDEALKPESPAIDTESLQKFSISSDRN